ncbi:hypothetical protein [Desertimonas flava]|uniref:hypothetical protein n=1 Tax=Desertimonas flava TaxID=2064846 RepID=UPI000E3448B4|nr:hypothetical protein [Desertimonas flava]
MKRLVLILLAAAASTTGAATARATTPEPPAGEPVTSGPVTATVVESYHSTAATQLVVIVEVTTTEPVTLDAFGAVYVGPDGQQVEATDYIAPDELFPGAFSLVVLAFPAASPGGNVMWSAYDDEYTDFDLVSPVPAA